MARKSKLQIWTEYAAARSLLAVPSTLPRKAALLFGRAVANLSGHALKNLRKVAYRNLEIALPDTGAEVREQIVKGTFENLGRILGEMSQFPRATRENLAELIEFRFDSKTLARHQVMRAGGRGTIIVSPHLGNWELLVFAYSALFEPISYLARPLDNPLIEDLTVKLRTRFGNRPINKTNSIHEAMRILREGGILGVLADVNSHPKEGVFVPFFGVPACTSSGVAMLALRTHAVIVPMAGVWDSEAKRYIAVHGELIEPVTTGNRKQDVVATTAQFTAEVEKLVRAYPEQWLWIHKRWRSRPPGEPSLY
jgi:KDO2-lipid IV(A) lauroyltransferase